MIAGAPAIKRDYVFARRNVSLRRWLATFILAFVGLGIIATFGLLTLHQSKTHYVNQITATAILFNNEKLYDTQSQIQDISNNFKLVVKVLGQELLYPQLINAITQTLPANANLTGLNISSSSAALDLSAVATDYNTATQVQVNLADPSVKIFSKVDIVSIGCSKANAANPNYPCTVSIRALFSPNNPYLFINSKKS